MYQTSKSAKDLVTLVAGSPSAAVVVTLKKIARTTGENLVRSHVSLPFSQPSSARRAVIPAAVALSSSLAGATASITARSRLSLRYANARSCSARATSCAICLCSAASDSFAAMAVASNFARRAWADEVIVGPGLAEEDGAVMAQIVVAMAAVATRTLIAGIWASRTAVEFGEHPTQKNPALCPAAHPRSGSAEA